VRKGGLVMLAVLVAFIAGVPPVIAALRQPLRAW